MLPYIAQIYTGCTWVYKNILSTYAKYGGETEAIAGRHRGRTRQQGCTKICKSSQGHALPTYCSRNVQKYQYPIMMLGGVDGERSKCPTLSSELGCLGPREEGQRRSNG